MDENERIHGDEPYVAEQEREAAEEAAAIGGDAGSYEAEEAERALAEAGQGEAEGFELAEEELIENASHEEPSTPDPTHLAGDVEELTTAEYGEADEEEQADL